MNLDGVRERWGLKGPFLPPLSCHSLTYSSLIMSPPLRKAPHSSIIRLQVWAAQSNAPLKASNGPFQFCPLIAAAAPLFQKEERFARADQISRVLLWRS